MSISQQLSAQNSFSALTAKNTAVDEQLQLLFQAIRLDNGDGIVEAFYRALELGGAEGIAAELKASELTDKMLTVLTKRAENLRTPLAWQQIADNHG